VRTDIPLADQIVQVGHACLEAGWQFAPPAAPCHLVVLSVVSEAHLHTMVADAALAGVRCAVFHEPDDGLGATAACSEPIAGAARRVFRRLPLWIAPTALVRARGPPSPPFPVHTHAYHRNEEGQLGGQWRPQQAAIDARDRAERVVSQPP
jgi:hypothetical protein